jgi:hypothetical protein
MSNSDGGGERHNKNKPPVHLYPMDTILSISEVFDFGRSKPNPYPERNWERGMPWGWVVSSLLRHIIADWQGEDRDPESGLLHAQHIATNAVMYLAYRLRDIGEDDRPCHQTTQNS